MPPALNGTIICEFGEKMLPPMDPSQVNYSSVFEIAVQTAVDGKVIKGSTLQGSDDKRILEDSS